MISFSKMPQNSLFKKSKLKLGKYCYAARTKGYIHVPSNCVYSLTLNYPVLEQNQCSQNETIYVISKYSTSPYQILHRCDAVKPNAKTIKKLVVTIEPFDTRDF